MANDNPANRPDHQLVKNPPAPPAKSIERELRSRDRQAHEHAQVTGDFVTDRDDGGQFTQSSEGLYGRDAELVDAGFKIMPDPNRKTGDDSLTENEVRDALAASQPDETPDEQIVYYDRDTLELSDPKEAITIEQAARDLTAWDEQKADAAAKSISSEFAAEVDKLRGDAVEADPKLAEERGIVEKPATNPDEPSIDGLDPDLEKALKHPQVRQAIEQELNSANQSREAYTAGLEQSRVHALASLAEVVPHLAGLPPAQFEQGLDVLRQVDPPAFQQAMNILGRTNAIVQAQQQEQQRQAHVERQQIETWANQQDARLDTMGVKFNKETVDNVLAYAGELGISRKQLGDAMIAHPILRSAEVQKMMADAASYHAARKAPAKAAPSSLPPVQRPGVPRSRVESESDGERSLSARFNATGSLKDAQKLYALQSSKRK